MNTYIILLRGINVGGKNKVSMAALKTCLEELDFSHVFTYIASGNVILQSNKSAYEIQSQIEAALPQAFKLDSALIKVLVLTHSQLRAIIDSRPEGFGDQPERYHSDVIFLMGLNTSETMKIFNPREGVDKIWQGHGVVYSQRLSAERTKSRLNAIITSPLYKSMTIRSWNTATKLLVLLNSLNARR